MTTNSSRKNAVESIAPAGATVHEMPTVIAAMLFSARRWHRSQSSPASITDGRAGIAVNDNQASGLDEPVDSAIKFG